MPTELDFKGQAINANLPGATGGSSEAGFGTLIGGLMSSIMAIAAILAFAFLIWGGIEWITSGGDTSKLESARNKITNAILGLIILAATTALFILLQQFLGICILNFGGTC